MSAGGPGGTPGRIVVRVAAPSWRRAVPNVGAKVRRWAAAALAGGAGGGEVTIVLAGDALVHRLNRDFRGKDKPTNVLSFPAGAGPAGSPPAGSDPAPEQPLGDIVIALETTRAEARAAGKTLADHLAHLVIHGVLHLLGHDHERSGPARRMERLEVRLLAQFGIADPYVAERRRA
jgi:probable rRNA maturation factor